MALIGYARVSTADQTATAQKDQLLSAGCDRIFEDTVSGSVTERPGLSEALNYLRADDILVVWRLDRLGRSLSHLIEIVADLQERGIGFRSLTESIATTTPGGRLIFHVFGALSQFERELIRERTVSGLTSAAARGRKGGRKHLVTDKMLQQAREYLDKGLSVRDAAKCLQVGKSTLYNALQSSATERPS